MSAPSPGPWRAGRTTGGALGIWSRDFKTDSPDVCDVAAVPDATDEANARLIAAAPELLACCKAMLAHMVDWIALEQAIEKAEGRL